MVSLMGANCLCRKQSLPRWDLFLLAILTRVLGLCTPEGSSVMTAELVLKSQHHLLNVVTLISGQ
jgi:hypothetical protein